MSRNVKTTKQIEGPSSTTRELADCVTDKTERSSEQAVFPESPQEGRMFPSFAYDPPLQDARVKDETADEQPQNLTSCGYEVATEEMVPVQSTKAAKNQTAAEPESKPAKRRRLTGRDVQKTLQTEGLISAKKEPADGVKVKTERCAEQQVNLESPQKERMNTDDLWLRVQEEIHKQSGVMFAGYAMKPSDKASVSTENVCGLDCMKMWPWMRDLPTSVWAGHGWAFDENGLRRLSSPGGSNAMQDVEVFESVGLAAEVKPTDKEIQEAPVAVAAAEHPPPPAEGQKPYHFMRNNLAKQSGIPNVKWNSCLCAWAVNFPVVDSKGKKTMNSTRTQVRRTNRAFAVKKFMGAGISESQADAAALDAAKAFRAELVEKGILSEPKPRDPNFTSEVPGVSWKKRAQKWQVQITPKDGKKRIHSGYFTEKAAAEAQAMRLQEKDGLQRWVKPVATLAELPVFHPKMPYPGVTWSQAEQQWRAKCMVGGATRDFRVKPKDHSEAELERSFQVSVAWKKKQEKEREKEGKAVKPKVLPAHAERLAITTWSWMLNTLEDLLRCPIDMALSRVPASMSASCSIFVGNVPYDALISESSHEKCKGLEAQEDELKELFGKVGNVTSDTKTPKGYAFADFADPASVQAAVEKLNHVEYNGRKLRIDVGWPRPRLGGGACPTCPSIATGSATLCPHAWRAAVAAAMGDKAALAAMGISDAPPPKLASPVSRQFEIGSSSVISINKELMKSVAELLKKKRLRASDLFKKIDASGDGNVTGEELRMGLHDLGFKLTDADLTSIMAVIDKDGGGEVSVKEFDRAMRAAEKLPSKKERQAMQEEKVTKKRGITEEDKEEFSYMPETDGQGRDGQMRKRLFGLLFWQIFCLFKQLSQARSAAGSDSNVSLAEWNETGTIGHLSCGRHGAQGLAQGRRRRSGDASGGSGVETEPFADGASFKQQDAMIGEIDMDGNGEIDFTEFCNSMARRMQIDYEPEDVTAAFKAFARNAPDGMIRVHDLREALRTYMHAEVSDSQVEELLQHYKECFVSSPDSNWEFFKQPGSLTIDPSSLPKVDTIADKLQRKKEQEAAEKAKMAQAEEAQRAEVARLMETLTPAQVLHVLGEMQRLTLRAPDVARALLGENAQLGLALQHAQFLAGMLEECFGSLPCWYQDAELGRLLR
eukprot:s1156_g34.t1